MKMQKQDEKFIKLLNNTLSLIKENKNLIADDIIYDMEDSVKSAVDYINTEKDKNRVLRIGIIGTVKAGKSSFLNSLVFEGKDILPKAATPMTASLTKISYSEIPEAKIVFYEDYDWKRIEDRANEYNLCVNKEFEKAKNEWEKNHSVQDLSKKDILTEVTREKVEKKIAGSLSPVLKGAAELVKMAQKNHVNIKELLGTEKIICGVENENLENYLKTLKEYVGSNGKYTPLVNYIELKLNNDLLKNVEIVDTPGLDDPIVSREEKTNDFLNKCDVVFLLSNVSQFITASDVNTIVNKFFKKGIKNIYIVGSQIDNGILQYNVDKETSLERAYGKSVEIYENQVKNILQKLKNDENIKKDMLQILEENNPLFISSMIYSIAKKIENKLSLNKDEQHTYDKLKKHFKDFDDVFENVNGFFEFAGIDYIKEDIYNDIRNDKDRILEEKIKNYNFQKSSEVLELLEKINMNVMQRRDEIKTMNESDLNIKLETYNNKLNSMRYNVKSIFSDKLVDILSSLEILKGELLEIVSSGERNIEIRQKDSKRTRTKSRLWGLITTTEEYDVKENCVQVSDAEDAVINFVSIAQKEINNVLDNLFGKYKGRKEFEKILKGLIEKSIDFSSKNFNKQEVLLPVEEVLKGYSYEKLDINVTNEIQKDFRNKFSDAIVTGQEIHELMREIHDKKINILNQLSQEIEIKGKDIQNNFINLQSSFIDNLQEKIESEINKTKVLLKNRQENIDKCNVLIDKIKILKSNFKEI